MNTTNRGLNRAVILLIGLVLLVFGIAAVLMAVVVPASTAWADSAPTVASHVDRVFAAAPLFATGTSWLAVAAIALLVVLTVLLLVFVLRQGNGHTNELFSDRTTEHGSTIVRSSVAKTVVEQALSGRDDIVGSTVTTSDVHGTRVLRISATVRRGVSPRDVANSIREALGALDQLLGFETPVLVRISSGLRSRVTAPARPR